MNACVVRAVLTSGCGTLLQELLVAFFQQFAAHQLQAQPWVARFWEAVVRVLAFARH